MAKNDSIIALEADPGDAEDFEVTADAVDTALDERRRRIGRPRGTTTSDREQIALRIPRPILEYFRGGGPGWQSRMIAVLAEEAKKAS